MKLTIVVSTALLLLVTGLCSANTESVIIRRDSGVIDWSSNTVSSRGSAIPSQNVPLPPADKQNRLVEIAKQRAFDNLFHTITGIYINSETSLAAILETRKELSDHLLAMVHNAPITQKEYLSDGSVELSVALNLEGGFAQLLLPDDIRQIEPVKTLSADPETTGSRPPATQVPSTDEKPDQNAQPFSGLIVDARGLALTPALSPAILNEDGKEAYGPAFISREYAVQSGTVAYFYSLPDSGNTRVGTNPLVVKGIKASGTLPTNIVISNADASKLHSSSGHLTFLNQCKVIIIIDPPKGQ